MPGHPMRAAVTGGKDGPCFTKHPPMFRIFEDHAREASIYVCRVQKYALPGDAAIIGVEQIRTWFVGFQFEYVTLRQQLPVNVIVKVNINKRVFGS